MNREMDGFMGVYIYIYGWIKRCMNRKMDGQID